MSLHNNYYYIKYNLLIIIFLYYFRYYELDSDDTILYSLRYKSILEYPEILVIMSIHREAFNEFLYVENSPHNKSIKRY